MRRFYQKEWFGIDFKSFTQLDSRNIADVAFYDKFYDEFYKRFSSYDDLPPGWRAEKDIIVNFLQQQTNPGDRLLSIGCGNGFIEYLLRKCGRKIVAIEPSQKATRFLTESCDIKPYNDYFPQGLKGEDAASFGLVYMIAIDYVFGEKEFLGLLEDVRKFGAKTFLLFSVSVYNRAAFVETMKYFAKSVLARAGLYDLGQFWGYLRTPLEFSDLFKKMGFKDIEKGFLADNRFWIKGTL